jgi:hypothetical protein
MHLLKYLLAVFIFISLPGQILFAQSDTGRVRSVRDTLRAAPARARAVPPVRLPAPGQDTTPPLRATRPLRRDSARTQPAPARNLSDSPPPKRPVQLRSDTTRAEFDTNAAGSAQISRQNTDTIPATPILTAAQRDSIRLVRMADSVRKNRLLKDRIESVQEVLRSHQYLGFFKQAEYRKMDQKRVVNKDLLFYFLCGLVLYFAILKLVFGKYLSNLFTLFFRVTMRQQQIREQLLQTPLPSLMLNILFAVSAGMYLNLILFYYKLNPDPSFWLSFSYCVALICLLYLGKLLILKTMGWIFNVGNATNTYLFIVFLVNKMIGMFLLPFLFLLAFPHPAILSGMVTLSFILVIALLIYRFIISYRPLRSEINVGRIHFIIYLCAFEIAPLLLIYKVLLNFVERNI